MASLLFLHRRRSAEEKPMVGGDIKFPESDLMIYGDLSFDDLLDFSCGDDDDDLSEPLSCPSWEDPVFHPPPPPPPSATTTTHGAQDHGLPCDDIEVAQLEWLSHFVEDSFSSGAGQAVVKTEISGGGGGSYRTPSPVSVLEQSNRRQLSPSPSSSSSGPATARGPRTKRPRPAAFNSLLPFAPPMGDAAAQEERAAKRTKVKKLRTVMKTAAEPSQLPAANGARRCTHCEIQKTPQWRAGPMGPKTLCNACGVRYKSGRLFPEYRPVASPTFVSAMHSNSHKKVVEMRSRMCPVTVALAPVALKGCELINYIRGGNSGDDDGGVGVSDGLEC